MLKKAPCDSKEQLDKLLHEEIQKLEQQPVHIQPTVLVNNGKDDRRKEYYLQNKETLLAKKRLWYVKKQKEVKAEQRQVHIDLKKRVLQFD